MSAAALARPTMTDEHTADALRDAALPGWRAFTHRTRTGVLIALTSPNYDPALKTGRMVAASGRDIPDAFTRALEMARGSLDRPQPQEKLH